MTRYTATYGERYAEVRAVPHWQLGSAWRVEVDGDPLFTRYADLDDAKRAAELRVGKALEWREEK